MCEPGQRSLSLSPSLPPTAWALAVLSLSHTTQEEEEEAKEQSLPLFGGSAQRRGSGRSAARSGHCSRNGPRGARYKPKADRPTDRRCIGN
ncbi:hypothetical protein chiPu_0030792 [Chiloscyllium punctatum]|uniref:Uncharacterized protein n=1 Tax=Chiloscyllium punctatum TaxID=137246 RepID=A0A401TVW1_CHIPU|nr:hypothetical protein [Chiloscyllium punctatum]